MSKLISVQSTHDFTSENTVPSASYPQEVMQLHKHAIGAEAIADHCLLVVQLGEQVHRDMRSFMTAKKVDSKLVCMHAVTVTPQINFCCFCLSCAPAASERMVTLHHNLSSTMGRSNLPQNYG